MFSLFAPWEILHDEPATGRRLEGKKLLEEFDLRYYPLSHQKPDWLTETELAVKLSIEDGYKAKLVIERVTVYRRLRVLHGITDGAPSRVEGIRGIVVPLTRTMYFSHRGKRNPKVLYEEVAHGMMRPVVDSQRPGRTRFERYKCHCQIYEGLSRSRFFKRLWFFGRREIQRLVVHLRPRCRMDVVDPSHPCTCTL